MTDIEKLRQRMKHMRVYEVAVAAGVHPNSLYKIMRGSNNVNYETVRIVLEYLDSSGVEK